MGTSVVGSVVRRIRQAEGDSLRAAEARTGIDHCVLMRLESGKPIRNLKDALAQIARAYGRPQELIEQGLDPRGAFDLLILQTSLHERITWWLRSPQQRLGMQLAFLLEEFAADISLEQLACAAGVPVSYIVRLQDGCASETEPGLAHRVAAALNSLTGVALSWSVGGLLEREAGFTSGFDTDPACTELAERAHSAPKRSSCYAALNKLREVERPSA